ncbi:LysR family substrate-binding domain-containing protein [Gemmobacter sp.]|uniref:LysR family substrate-binding domain-containing protein n=1 Tax=Gemmobacter sp. TaxID=1898957 RepID=UPI002AFE06A8|nr:LysR family substrate-binding domain-containing protein [Gemmobacter sp.]
MGRIATYAGQRFLLRTRQVIRSVGEGALDVAAAGRSEEGRVRIGIYSSIASGFLSDLLANYGKRYAKVRIKMVDGNPVEHVAAIRQLSLDVAFITGTRDWPDCERTPLWSERVFAVLPLHHRLTEQEELSWSDLADETFIVMTCPPVVPRS